LKPVRKGLILKCWRGTRLGNKLGIALGEKREVKDLGIFATRLDVIEKLQKG
jgi:hypothetical protein